VSFMDPASLTAATQTHKHTGTHKSRKRGRGRPPLLPASSLSANAPAIQGEPNAVSGSLHNSEHKLSGEISETQPKSNQHELLSTATDVNNNDSSMQDDEQNPMDIGHSHSKDDDEEEDEKEEEKEGYNETAGTTVVNEAVELDHERVVVHSSSNGPETAIIPDVHPLAGVWKGNFSITTPKGEEKVEEILFFYSMLGKSDQFEQFKDLPPEPQFPYTLLRRIEGQPKVKVLLSLFDFFFISVVVTTAWTE
jgi:hypothetical protein